VLLTTQDLDEADALAGHIVIINSGRVIDTGSPAELKARFGTVVFDLGFGTPADAQAAEAALSARGYQPDQAGGQLRVRSGSGSGALIGVLRALDGNAPDPVSVDVHQPTLDDAFLAVTNPGTNSHPNSGTNGGKAA
jgi:ABC-type multidrug transport system ATPase subunit